jgi:type VI secretion system secreted protein VgrG
MVDQILADEQVTSLASAGNVIWPLTDHLNTVRDLADRDESTGAVLVTNHRVYDSFGQLVSETNAAVDEVFGFTARFFDKESGLQNNWNRWYDVEVGKWISEDPIVFFGGDSNLFRYVNNSPIQSVDPSGLYTGVDDAFFAIGGALVGVAGQGLSDLVSGELSGWEDYVGSAAGGALGGWALLYTGPVGSGAIGGAATNAIKQGLKIASGKQDTFCIGDLLFDTTVGAATGFIPGVRIPGITAGRGSYNSVFKQMTTKLQNGTIRRVTPCTAFKMVVGRMVDTATVPGAGAAVVASFSRSKVQKLMESASSHLENAQAAYASAAEHAKTLECPSPTDGIGHGGSGPGGGGGKGDGFKSLPEDNIPSPSDRR